MVTSKATIDAIRRIVAKHYAMMTISVLGAKVFSKTELDELARMGVDTSDRESLLAAIYYHNFINSPITDRSPKDLKGMRRQQSQRGIKPEQLPAAEDIKKLERSSQSP